MGADTAPISPYTWAYPVSGSITLRRSTPPRTSRGEFGRLEVAVLDPFHQPARSRSKWNGEVDQLSTYAKTCPTSGSMEDRRGLRHVEGGRMARLECGALVSPHSVNYRAQRRQRAIQPTSLDEIAGVAMHLEHFLTAACGCCQGLPRYRRGRASQRAAKFVPGSTSMMTCCCND